MRTILIIITLLLITVNTTAQVDNKKTIEKDSPEDYKKYGVGITFSILYGYNEALWGYDVEKTDAFYDLYYQWPFPFPPGIEILFQPSKFFTYRLGLKYKAFRKFTPKEYKSGIFDFTNLTTYTQLNFSPFRTKHKPYIGLKLLFEYKYYISSSKNSNNYKRWNKSQLASLQVPLGYSFTIKKYINISIETTFNLLSYTSSKFETKDMIIYYPSTSPTPIKNSGSYTKFWSPLDLEKGKHLTHALLIKICYRFNIKNQNIAQ